jgi:hypothetical protein
MDDSDSRFQIYVVGLSGTGMCMEIAGNLKKITIAPGNPLGTACVCDMLSLYPRRAGSACCRAASLAPHPPVPAVASAHHGTAGIDNS